MRKHISIILVAVVISAVAFLVASCSSNRQDPGTANLRWSAFAYAKFDTFREEESRRFERDHPDVRVKYEPISSSDYGTKILTQIAGGTAPDVFATHLLTGQLIKNKTLLDLTGYVEKDEEHTRDMLPSVMNLHRRDGRIYTLPGNVTVDILYYNKSLFKEAGLPYPEDDLTWSEFTKLARKLTKRDASGRVVRFGCVTDAGADTYLTAIFQNGGKLWSDDKSRCVINTPESREALQFIGDLFLKYHASPKIAEMRDQGERELFAAGRAGMFWGNSWHVAVFKIKGTKDLDWDAILLPQPDGKKRVFTCRANTLAYGVWSGSKHPADAVRLAKFMTSPEAVKFMVEMGDSLPTHSKGADMDYYVKHDTRPARAKKVMLEALEKSSNAFQMISHPKVQYAEIYDILGSALGEFNLGMKSAEETLKKIESELNNRISK